MKIDIELELKLRKGELKVFSIYVTNEKDIKIIGKLVGVAGQCLSCDGRDYLGKEFIRTINLKRNESKRLWYFIQAPKDVDCGIYDFEILICDENDNLIESKKFNFTVIEGEADNDFSDIESLSRLIWLNSDYSIDDRVPKPFIPVKVKGSCAEILGRKVYVDALGMPKSIRSFFSKSVQICKNATELLSGSMRFMIGKEELVPCEQNVEEYNDRAVFKTKSDSQNFITEVESVLEFDGFWSFSINVQAKRNIVSDVKLEIPFREEVLQYFMGLGQMGGKFSGQVDWKWNKERNQDCFWAGSVHAGLQVKLKGKNYRKPLVNVYYEYKKLNIPEEWNNEGKGGISYQNGVFSIYTGEREFLKNMQQNYRFELYLTPFKPIDTDSHFSTKIYHRMPAKKVDINEAGAANVVNIHHGNDYNPFINYPFFECESLKELIDTAHLRNMLVKLYYTVRELTVYLPEFKAFMDMGDEIITRPRKEINIEHLWQQDALRWMKENVGTDVIPAWQQPLKGEKYHDMFDSSVITEGASRLCNFYIEGLKYLVEKLKIDGIYIDDVAYDRNTMKRVRKTLDENPKAHIDFHVWNSFGPLAGYVSCFNQYAELLPYVNKMWVGEGFDYSRSFDYWLIEISGIPFGVMSDLMSDCERVGNVYRGLVFGMTNRRCWDTCVDPTPIWQLFDKYALNKSELIGAWDERNNVVTENENVISSVYVVGEKRYIALANWTSQPQKITLSLKNETVNFFAPYIENFQTETKIVPDMVIPAEKGYFIEII